MTEFWKSSQKNYWCQVCKTWVRDSLQGRALHENGPRHKELVEKKLRDARRNADKQEEEEERTREALGKIESLAQRQFERDQKAFSTSRQEENSSAGRQRPQDETEMDLERKKAAERAYRQEQQQTTGATASSSSSKISDWIYDPNSGYYCSHEASCYYDSYSGMYYYDDTWTKQPPEPKNAAKLGGVSGGVLETQGGKEEEKGEEREREKKTMVSTSSQQPRVLVVKPVKKMAQRTNQSLGGYQMPLYGGQVGGQKQIGKQKTTKNTTTATTATTATAKLAGPSSGKITKKKKKIVTAEERKALNAREAAKKRVEMRTRAQFGFS